MTPFEPGDVLITETTRGSTPRDPFRQRENEQPVFHLWSDRATDFLPGSMIPIHRAVVPKGLLEVLKLSGITLGKWIAGRNARLLKESILFVFQCLAGGRVRLSNQCVHISKRHVAGPRFGFCDVAVDALAMTRRNAGTG